MRKKDIAEIIIAKHRGGSTGTVELLWLEVILSLSIWREDLMTNNKKEDLKSNSKYKLLFFVW